MIILLTLLLGKWSFAEDKTPYNWFFFGNIYGGTSRFTDQWLAERYDLVLNGDYSLLEGIRSAADNMGKVIWIGPYTRAQDFSLRTVGNGADTVSYESRWADRNVGWRYKFAKFYMDSVGVDPESLVVHWADTMYAARVPAAGVLRVVHDADTLPLRKKRFTIDNWNNTPEDTVFYPAGTSWLANGYNPVVRQAILSAFKKSLYYMPDSIGFSTNEPWTAVYMDDQLQWSHAELLYGGGYWEVDSTRGGPTTSGDPDRGNMDWVEKTNIWNADSANNYGRWSTFEIDSTLMTNLEPLGIKIFANIDAGVSGNEKYLSDILPYVSGVTWELFWTYNVYWGNWKLWYDCADTVRNHPDKYIAFQSRGNLYCSNDPSDWNYDSSRVYLASYAWFLTAQDPNIFWCGAYYNDSLRWRNIYEVDLGTGDPGRTAIDSLNSGSNICYVIRRNYGDNAVLFMTSNYGINSFSDDSIQVNLHGLYQEVSANADTSAYADSLYYMKPYMGKVFIAASGEACTYPPSVPEPSSPTPGSTVTTPTPILCVNNSTQINCAQPIVYYFQVSLQSSFSRLASESDEVPQGAAASSITCWQVPDSLEAGKTYYWRARAMSGAHWSNWSSPQAFLSQNSPPSVPELVAPESSAVIDGSHPVLVIQNSTDPEGATPIYHFQVSAIPSFASVACEEGNVPEGSSTTSWQVPIDLANHTTYYWRARAFDGIAYSNWQDAPHSFSIDMLVLDVDDDAPAIVSPAYGATVTSNKPTFQVSWSSGSDSSLCSFEVASDSIFGDITDGGAVVGKNFSASWIPNKSLQSGKAYYWRARLGDGDYSEAAPFAVSTQVFVSPNPFSYLDGNLTFHNLPRDSKVEVYTTAGDRVWETGSLSGDYQWDVRNSSGQKLASGVYLYYVKSDDGVVSDKFVVVR